MGLSIMIYLKQYSKPHHKLVLILFLTLLPDAFQATVIVASWTTNHVFCTFSGIIDQFSFVGGCAWFVTITINLYRMLVLLHRFTSDDFPMMHWIVWSYTLMMCFLPLITNSYVPIGSWCWISGSTTPGKVMRFTTFYGPLLVQIILVFILCIIIGISLWRKRLRSSITRRAKQMSYFLFLYPMAFMICWLPPIINRYYILSTSNQIFGLNVAHVLGVRLLPAVCVVLYGATSVKRVYQKLSSSYSERFSFTDTRTRSLSRSIGQSSQGGSHSLDEGPSSVS